MRTRIISFFVLIFCSVIHLQAQRISTCDSLAAKGMGRTLADSALYYGMQAGCAEQFLTLFNPPFAHADDCCALSYLAAKGLFCIFVDEQSKEGNMLFDVQYRKGYNYVMQQRIEQKIGKDYGNIPADIYQDREEVNAALVEKISKSIRVKAVMPGRVKVKLKSKKFSDYDSVPITCLPEPLNGLMLKDLRPGIVIPSRNDAEKHTELLLLTLNFSAVKKNSHLCVCENRSTYSIRLAAKARKKK